MYLLEKEANPMKDQLYLDKDMRPADDPDVPEIRDGIYEWLSLKDEQAQLADRIKAKGDALMVQLKEHKLEHHPYVDPKTGKKKWWVADTTPKPKTITAPRKKRREDDAQIGDEIEATDRPKKAKDEDVVEKRRVSRKSVEKEIDGFAATRRAMDEDKVH